MPFLKIRPVDDRFRYDVTESAQSTVISRGLTEMPSDRYMIDSQLDRFLANGNHQTVTMSPTKVRASVAASAARGKRTHAASRNAKQPQARPKYGWYERV